MKERDYVYLHVPVEMQDRGANMMRVTTMTTVATVLEKLNMMRFVASVITRQMTNKL